MRYASRRIYNSEGVASKYVTPFFILVIKMILSLCLGRYKEVKNEGYLGDKDET
jgi:hypothetical protein